MIGLSAEEGSEKWSHLAVSDKEGGAVQKLGSHDGDHEGNHEVFLLHSSLDIKECDKVMIPNELALKMTSRNCAPSPTLVNQSISLSTFISVGRFASSRGKKGSVFLENFRQFRFESGDGNH